MAIADLMITRTECVLNRINVPKPYRGRGFASTLLRTILADADREGVRLTLGVDSSGGLSVQQLVAWYKRHGFVMVGPPGYSQMVRHPMKKIGLIINRRGCKQRMDAKTAEALNEVAEKLHEHFSKEINRDPQTSQKD